MSRTVHSDPFADSCEAFLTSHDGKVLLDPWTLGNPPNPELLRDRIRDAFLKGWIAAVDSAEESE